MKKDNETPFYKLRRVQATALILFALIIELGSAIIYRIINPVLPFPEILYYSSQIISSIFVISGVVIAVWQYYLTSKSTKTDLEIQQVQRAIDLAQYYKDNILKYSAAIDYIYDKSGILNIINTLKLEQFNDFDKHELNNLLTTDQIQKLKEIQASDLFIQTVIEANTIYNLHMEIQTEKLPVNKNGKAEYSVTFNKTSAIIAFASYLVSNVLNNMEFFALHFSHKTADESVVYQSLHQSYFEMIKYMYYYIAKYNEDPSDKFYTNATKLFIDWRNEKNKQNEQRSEKTKTIPRKGTIIEVKVNRNL